MIGFFTSGYSQTVDAQTPKLIHFYPNPAINFINFEKEESTDKECSLQVYNFIGKKVVDIPNMTAKVNIPLNDFFRGIYIYQLRNKVGKIIESGKFQVVK